MGIYYKIRYKIRGIGWNTPASHFPAYDFQGDPVTGLRLTIFTAKTMRGKCWCQATFQPARRGWPSDGVDKVTGLRLIAHNYKTVRGRGWYQSTFQPARFAWDANDRDEDTGLRLTLAQVPHGIRGFSFTSAPFYIRGGSRTPLNPKIGWRLALNTSKFKVSRGLKR